tara:strand:+ start:365 stop:595 length:231 start_codon:yes stop_codon:yes gene_type:complete
MGRREDLRAAFDNWVNGNRKDAMGQFVMLPNEEQEEFVEMLSASNSFTTEIRAALVISYNIGVRDARESPTHPGKH